MNSMAKERGATNYIIAITSTLALKTSWLRWTPLKFRLIISRKKTLGSFTDDLPLPWKCASRFHCHLTKNIKCQYMLYLRSHFMQSWQLYYWLGSKAIRKVNTFTPCRVRSNSVTRLAYGRQSSMVCTHSLAICLQSCYKFQFLLTVGLQSTYYSLHRSHMPLASR